MTTERKRSGVAQRPDPSSSSSRASSSSRCGGQSCASLSPISTTELKDERLVFSAARNWAPQTMGLAVTILTSLCFRSPRRRLALGRERRVAPHVDQVGAGSPARRLDLRCPSRGFPSRAGAWAAAPRRAGSAATATTGRESTAAAEAERQHERLPPAARCAARRARSRTGTWAAGRCCWAFWYCCKSRPFTVCLRGRSVSPNTNVSRWDYPCPIRNSRDPTHAEAFFPALRAKTGEANLRKSRWAKPAAKPSGVRPGDRSATRALCARAAFALRHSRSCFRGAETPVAQLGLFCAVHLST